jgi:crotonobetainyl-CoA:carnitine CoA-transferase CaiB-like acyl-CoA transferase
VPVHFSATPGRVRHAGPALGEHSAEVFEQFGISRAQDLGEPSA